MNHRSSNRPFLLLLVAAMAAGLAGGCTDEDRTARGAFVVRVSDAPYPFEAITSAQVLIDRVEVYVDADVDGESAFYVLSEESHVVELMELRNGVTEVLVSADLPAGVVDQIRVRIPEGSVTLTDGRTFDLRVPSGDTSGLKIFPQPPIAVGAEDTTEVLLDFDVSGSFRAIPASARRAADIRSFHFHPVLRVANLSTSGAVSGLVREEGRIDGDAGGGRPVGGAEVEAVSGSDVAHTSTGPDGRWTILGLAPGTWDVRAAATGCGEKRARVLVEPGKESGGVELVLPVAAPDASGDGASTD